MSFSQITNNRHANRSLRTWRPAFWFEARFIVSGSPLCQICCRGRRTPQQTPASAPTKQDKEHVHPSPNTKILRNLILCTNQQEIKQHLSQYSNNVAPNYNKLWHKTNRNRRGRPSFKFTTGTHNSKSEGSTVVTQESKRGRWSQRERHITQEYNHAS